MITQNDNIISSKDLDRIISYDNDWTQITIGDQRYYKKDGFYFPSVTYILSYYPKGKQFEQFLKDNGDNANEIAREAAERGSNVHKAIEYMLEGNDLRWIKENGYASYSLDEWLMIVRFAEFWNEHKPKLVASELHIFSGTHKFAGTIDLVLEINKELWIIDIKTSKGLYITYDLQTAAYAKAWNELNERKINKTGILWLKAKTRKPAADKIQGRGWSLTETDRTIDQNFEIFNWIYNIFKLENPELKPISESYPNSVKLQFD